MDDLTKQGNELLKQGRWTEARSIFEQSLALRESAEALEGLGDCCSWLNDGEGVVSAREAAFRLYVKAGDNRSAARVATRLANEYGEYRGEGAVAAGWLGRARRLVEDLEPCEEQAVVLAATASVMVFVERDPVSARQLAARARSIAAQVGSVDGQMIANALEGLARVSEGEVQEGMRLLDEATATAVGGECENLGFIGAACCCLISACERVRDYERAAQWCDHVKGFCRRWRIRSLFSICRTQYSAVLISRGEWAEAEEELASAAEELTERRPGLAVSATVRLAELRRRQGRLEEARELFQSTESHLASQLGRAAMALDEDDPQTAAELVQRLLRRLAPGEKIERVPALEILARAFVRAGEAGKAKGVLSELRAIVNAIPTDPLRASTRLAEGVVAEADGRPGESLASFEDAVDLFEKACMPYESIVARLELMRALLQQGKRSRAESEGRSARKQAVALGAEQLIRAIDLLVALPAEQAAVQPERRDERALSPREREVLLLLAEGKDNNRIADELFLSVRTVERHVSNTYQKLGISGKSARSAATAYTLKNLLRHPGV